MWVEIARELLRALGVDGKHASGVAAAIKGLLSAETDEAARSELDELGFPALDETTHRDAKPRVADDLGGEPVLDEDGSEIDISGVDAESKQPGEASSPTTPDDAELSPFSGEATPPSEDDDSGQSRAASASSQRSGFGEEGSQGIGGAYRSRISSAQSRLRSYITPLGGGSEASPDTPDSDTDSEVERAGVAAVLEFERIHGREPVEMPPMNPGFDIRSVDADGGVRIIEVKATADEWGPRGVAISSTQFATAQQRREQFWLYVVDRAIEAPRVHTINDPATKIAQYFFDNGWRAATEGDHEPERPIPSLKLPRSPQGIPGAVAFLDSAEGEAATSGWVACEERRRKDSWFAVRVRGDSLGMAYRGGIAFAEPIDREVEDDELVVAVLHRQMDPDTGLETTIRRWRPERECQRVTNWRFACGVMAASNH